MYTTFIRGKKPASRHLYGSLIKSVQKKEDIQGGTLEGEGLVHVK